MAAAAAHGTTAGELRAWRREAAGLAGAHPEPADPALGLTRAELRRELGWLLEDAVAAGAGWERGPDGAEVRLRAALPELRRLWRARVEARVPFQYIVACSHWHELTFAVGPGVLIPRPETEELLDLVRGRIAANPALAAGPWADLGTGSGALACGLAAHLRRLTAPPPPPPAAGPGPRVWAVDVSPAAEAYARSNVRRLGLEGEVAFARGSWFEPLAAAGLEGRVAGIVTNPPYIPSESLPHLQAEVGLHEPYLALDGGPGAGLAALAHLVEHAPRFLRPGGLFAAETEGLHQTQRLAAALRRGPAAARVGTIDILPDLAGKERFLLAEMRA